MGVGFGSVILIRRTNVVKGVMRLAHHVCATCLLKEGKREEHPECSTVCPHSAD